jgi:prolyl 4-hydroxylase
MGTDFKPDIVQPDVLSMRMSKMKVLDADARIFLYEHFLTDGELMQLSVWQMRRHCCAQQRADQVQDELSLVLPLRCTEEADHIVAVSEKRLERSGVVSTDGGSEESGIRTSFGVFLERQEDEIVKRIEERISAWTMMPVGNGEGLQVVMCSWGACAQAGGVRGGASAGVPSATAHSRHGSQALRLRQPRAQQPSA